MVKRSKLAAGGEQRRVPQEGSARIIYIREEPTMGWKERRFAFFRGTRGWEFVADFSRRTPEWMSVE